MYSISYMEGFAMFRTLIKRALGYLTKENVPEEHSSVLRYELTIIRFTPDPVQRTSTLSSGPAAATWIGAPLDTDCFIEASVNEGKYSLGDFYLWCSGEYAVARIGEHRSHHASHPHNTFAIGKTITFKDDDGSLYTPSNELVLPRELALSAMRAWLIDLKHPSFLRWS
ncbi:hypothetical protein [Duganella sp. Leaf61]|uniref:hypothetical protein n=1 Tax=Duganella sp. Leaf61 TaxID=1736227 RepID=UPI0012E181CA|nr:hypothetical protein [Duganella sp. Leaf61]